MAKAIARPMPVAAPVMATVLSISSCGWVSIVAGSNGAGRESEECEGDGGAGSSVQLRGTVSQRTCKSTYSKSTHPKQLSGLGCQTAW